MHLCSCFVLITADWKNRNKYSVRFVNLFIYLTFDVKVYKGKLSSSDEACFILLFVRLCSVLVAVEVGGLVGQNDESQGSMISIGYSIWCVILQACWNKINIWGAAREVSCNGVQQDLN